jgi:hypothetical protein
VVEGEAALRV